MTKVKALVAAFLTACWCGGAIAAEIETARMTSAEIAEAVKAGQTTIIIPSGGTEQNGPHMVTGKHNFIVAETARRIATELGDALVAPVMPLTPEGDIARREGHMAFPGSISIPPDVFENVLVAAGESFAIHGFKTIVFLGDSGPNQEPQRLAADRINKVFGASGVHALSADKYYADNGQVAWLKSQGETDDTIGPHAGIRDTSEMMVVEPDGVRTAKLAAGGAGATGDPSRASAERGAALLALKIKAAVAEIRAAQTAGPATAGSAEAGPATAGQAPSGSSGDGGGALSRAWHWLTGR